MYSKHLKRKMSLWQLLVFSFLFMSYSLYANATLQNSYTLAELNKLTATDAVADDYFAYSVGISGNYAIVGAFKNSDNGSASGSAYIFKNDGSGTFSEVGKLTASDAATDDYFGESVSISGNYAIVGAYNNDDNGSNSGSAYIFKNDGSGNFSEVGKLTASDAAEGDWFGYSVSISGDYAIVGADNDDDNGSASGSAYIFKNDGSGNFSELGKLTASDATWSDHFGESVSISGDYAIVGAHYNDDNGSNSGSAYIFKNDGSGNFSEVSKLTASDAAADDYFGSSVSITEDYTIVGAFGNDDNGSNSGSAYIFKNDGSGNFSEVSKLTTSDAGADDWFGYSVSISGNYTIVGAFNNSDNGSYSGSAYIFKNDGSGNFSEVRKLTASDAAAGDYFGESVSISGNYVMVSAYRNDDNGSNSGSAYIFSPEIDVSVVENSTNVIDIDTTEATTYSITGIDSNKFTIDSVTGVVTFKVAPDFENPSDANGDNIYEAKVVTNNSTVVLHVRVKDEVAQLKNEYTLAELNKLTASDAAEYDRFGRSVSISGEYAIVGAYYNDDNGSASGSAYIFKNDGSGTFSEVGKLTASDAAAGDYFGESVSISGNYVIVGAYNNDDNGSNSGSAYIFKNDGSGNFSEVGKLTASDAAEGDWFGYSVSISGDYAIVGAFKNSDNGSNSGSAYIFKNDGSGTFSEVSKLTASDAATDDRFGLSVSISGAYAIVGASLNSDNGSYSGSAYIFKNDGSRNFSEVSKLTASDAAGYDYFGYSVSISGDYAIVGAYQNDDNGSASGSAYIFKNDGSGNFSEVSKLTASDAAAGDYFAYSVGISGNYAIVGAFKNSDNGSASGSAYIFKNDGSGNFSEVSKLTASDAAADDWFGYSVSISGDYAIVGAYQNDDNDSASGSAYIFSPEIDVSVVENSTDVIDIDTTDATTYSIIGIDSNKFTIDSVTGVITFKVAPDFENPSDDNGDNIYDVRVNFTDTTSIQAVLLHISVEDNPDYDNDGFDDNIDDDDDNDGMPDSYEDSINGLNSLYADDANEDLDSDGYTNLQEYQAQTDPTDADSKPTASNNPTIIMYLLN